MDTVVRSLANVVCHPREKQACQACPLHFAGLGFGHELVTPTNRAKVVDSQGSNFQIPSLSSTSYVLQPMTGMLQLGLSAAHRVAYCEVMPLKVPPVPRAVCKFTTNSEPEVSEPSALKDLGTLHFMS